MESKDKNNFVLVTQQEATSAIPFTADKIILKNLQVTANAGYDSWGREKIQPALISVTLSLRQPFNSAASTDKVDNSTVHYGKLGKTIMATIQDLSSSWLSTRMLAHHLNAAVNEVAGSDSLLAACEIEICYPKGSMLGDGAGLLSCFTSEANISHTYFVRDMRIPCLIGVNSHERLRKQMVVASIWVDCISDGDGRSEAYTEMEVLLSDIIDKSSFETIESLVATAAEEFKTRMSSRHLTGSTIRLRVGKPVAVPFAEAPAIEIVRSGRL